MFFFLLLKKKIRKAYQQFTVGSEKAAKKWTVDS